MFSIFPSWDAPFHNKQRMMAYQRKLQKVQDERCLNTCMCTYRYLYTHTYISIHRCTCICMEVYIHRFMYGMCMYIHGSLLLSSSSTVEVYKLLYLYSKYGDTLWVFVEALTVYVLWRSRSCRRSTSKPRSAYLLLGGLRMFI